MINSPLLVLIVEWRMFAPIVQPISPDCLTKGQSLTAYSTLVRLYKAGSAIDYLLSLLASYLYLGLQRLSTFGIASLVCSLSGTANSATVGTRHQRPKPYILAHEKGGVSHCDWPPFSASASERRFLRPYNCKLSKLECLSTKKFLSFSLFSGRIILTPLLLLPVLPLQQRQVLDSASRES